MDQDCKQHIIKLNETTTVPDCVHNDYMETFGNSLAPIVIDNGIKIFVDICVIRRGLSYNCNSQAAISAELDGHVQTYASQFLFLKT